MKSGARRGGATALFLCVVAASALTFASAASTLPPDTTMTAAEKNTWVHRIYVAAFARAADNPGYVFHSQNTGASLHGVYNFAKVMYGAAASGTETGANYLAGDSPRQFVEKLYTNILNRASATAGSDYWTGQVTAYEAETPGDKDAARGRAMVDFVSGVVANTAAAVAVERQRFLNRVALSYIICQRLGITGTVAQLRAGVKAVTNVFQTVRTFIKTTFARDITAADIPSYANDVAAPTPTPPPPAPTSPPPTPAGQTITQAERNLWVHRLFVAWLRRLAATDKFEYWSSMATSQIVNTREGLVQMSASFYEMCVSTVSPYKCLVVTGLSDDSLVRALYAQVEERVSPDASGLAFWKGQLARLDQKWGPGGRASARGELMVDFIAGVVASTVPTQAVSRQRFLNRVAASAVVAERMRLAASELQLSVGYARTTADFASVHDFIRAVFGRDVVAADVPAYAGNALPPPPPPTPPPVVVLPPTPDTAATPLTAADRVVWVHRLYVAWFGRLADRAGADFWQSASASGVPDTLEGVMAMSTNFYLTAVGKVKQSSEVTRFLAAADQSDEAFIEHVYLQVIGRPAEAAGQTYWVSQLNVAGAAGGGAEAARGKLMLDFIQAFLLADSPGDRDRQLRFANRVETSRLLAAQAAQTATATPAELRDALARISSDWATAAAVLRARGVAVQDELGEEAWRVWVHRLYVAWLARAADKPGFAYYMGGGTGIARSMARLVEMSREFYVVASSAAAADKDSVPIMVKAGTADNDTFIRALYVLMLRRNPDEAGRLYWARHLRDLEGSGLDKETARAQTAIAVLTAWIEQNNPNDPLYAQFLNRVSVSRYAVEKTGTGDFPIDVLRAVLVPVTDDWASAKRALEVQGILPSAPAPTPGGAPGADPTPPPAVPELTVGEFDAWLHRLYVGWFRRAPQAEGFSYWRRNTAQTMAGVMDTSMHFYLAAVDKNEVSAFEATQSDTEFVETVYAQMLRRIADEKGRDYWVGQLQALESLGQPAARGRLAVMILFAWLSAGSGDDVLLRQFHNRVAVSMVVLASGKKLSLDELRKVLKDVDDSANSQIAALGGVSIALPSAMPAPVEVTRDAAAQSFSFSSAATGGSVTGAVPSSIPAARVESGGAPSFGAATLADGAVADGTLVMTGGNGYAAGLGTTTPGMDKVLVGSILATVVLLCGGVMLVMKRRALRAVSRGDTQRLSQFNVGAGAGAGGDISMSSRLSTSEDDGLGEVQM